MKYIRTKDGILLNDINNDKYYEWLQTEPILHDIIAKADTIEELCDEFVIVFSDNRKQQICDTTLKIRPCGADTYGAIWTDKGLIYVARMNNEGELELL